MRSIPLVLVACALLAGCSPGGDGPECTGDAECPAGYYCRQGDCVFDCTHDAECPEDYRCTSRGRCELGCKPTNGGVELCDQVDNDCDGETDEGFEQVGTPCDNQGCAGTWVCSGDGREAVCDAPAPDPDDASCDGVDSDCDGETDEDAVRDCPLQAGVCTGAVDVCLGGSWSGCDYGEHYTEEQDAICETLDNDCDGETDEDADMVLEPESGTQASDGLDNNCNGLVDEPGGVLVPVPGVDGLWIDAYEIGAYQNADCTGNQYGVESDDFPAGFPAEGAASVELFACSLPGVMPSGHLSWHRARRVCESQGKRLCTRQEWGNACTGAQWRDFPYGPDFVGGVCNDALGGTGQLAQTGAYPDCTAGLGTYDQSGNLHEWLQDWSDNDPDGALAGGFGYACAICSLQAGEASCSPCDPDNPDDTESMIHMSDCNVGDTPLSRFPRATVLPWLGTRCCYQPD